MKNYRLILSRLLMLICVLLCSANAMLAHAATADQPPANAFTGKDAAGVIGEALVKAGAGDDLKVSINEAREEDVIASAVAPLVASTDNFEFDKPHNRWKTTLLLQADGRNLAPIKLSGHYDEMTPVPVLKRRIQSGEVISEDDIDWDKQPLSRLRKNTVTDIHALIGKSPRRVISQGRPIRTDEIASPATINKGTRVTLFYKSRNIEIKTFGEALDSGAMGDVIRVRNTASKVVVQGKVESSDSVRVTSPDSTTAEAM